MQASSKMLQETLSEVYEGEWPGHDQLYVQGQNSEMLWADLAHKLSDQVLIPLNTYQGQFPEMRVIYIFTSQHDKSKRLVSISTSYCIIELLGYPTIHLNNYYICLSSYLYKIKNLTE